MRKLLILVTFASAACGSGAASTATEPTGETPRPGVRVGDLMEPFFQAWCPQITACVIASVDDYRATREGTADLVDDCVRDGVANWCSRRDCSRPVIVDVDGSAWHKCLQDLRMRSCEETMMPAVCMQILWPWASPNMCVRPRPRPGSRLRAEPGDMHASID